MKNRKKSLSHLERELKKIANEVALEKFETAISQIMRSIIIGGGIIFVVSLIVPQSPLKWVGLAILALSGILFYFPFLKKPGFEIIMELIKKYYGGQRETMVEAIDKKITEYQIAIDKQHRLYWKKVIAEKIDCLIKIMFQAQTAMLHQKDTTGVELDEITKIIMQEVKAIDQLLTIEDNLFLFDLKMTLESIIGDEMKIWGRVSIGHLGNYDSDDPMRKINNWKKNWVKIITSILQDRINVLKELRKKYE